MIKAAEKFINKEHYTGEDLREILALLRAPDGCPWDRVQTHQSIRRGIIEEAYEVAEAIDREDPAMMTEELGDILMQVYFHAALGEEEGAYSLQEVYDRVCKKLIFRHPHIFADAPDDFGSSEEDWLAIKRLEKGQKSLFEEMDGVARTLPSLTRAEKLAGKLFPKEEAEPLYEILINQAHALQKGCSADRLSDLLFTLCRIAKAEKIDPELALFRKNEEKIAKINENS